MLWVVIRSASPCVRMQKLLTFFAEKNVKSYSHFFSKNISLYAIFNDQSFNGTLTNNIVSFEQLGPDQLLLTILFYFSW